MTTPLLHYPARSRPHRPAYTSLSQRTRPPWAAAQVNAIDRSAQAPKSQRALRNGAQFGAAIVGGIGLAIGCVAIAVNWLLAVETHASDLPGALEWAARVTMLGLVAGGIAGGAAGAFIGIAMRVMRAQYERPASE